MLYCYYFVTIINYCTTNHDLVKKSNELDVDIDLNTLTIGDEDFCDMCDYHDLTKDDNIMSKSERDLNIVQLNIRGLVSKQNALMTETIGEKSNREVHIYILNETWVTKKK